MTTMTAPGSQLTADLFVVGFHGHVSADSTPARLDSIYTDATGRLFSVNFARNEREESNAHFEQLPSLAATVFPSRLSARMFRHVYVLGELEMEFQDALQSCVCSVGYGDLWHLFRFLKSDALVPDCPTSAVRLNPSHVAWLATDSVANEMDRRIACVAQAEIVRALCEQNSLQACRMAWWLHRAARSQKDELDAAAAFQLAGDTNSMRIIIESGHLNIEEDDRSLETQRSFLQEQMQQYQQHN